MHRYAALNAAGQWLFDFSSDAEEHDLILADARRINPAVESIRLVSFTAGDREK